MPAKLTEERLSPAIDLYASGLSVENVAKKMGICDKSVSTYLKQKKVKVGLKNGIPEETQKEIINKYKTGKYSCAKLGREYGFAQNSINRLLRKCGIEIIDNSKLRQIYTLDENYFEKIDTKEKAYWLGLLYADGYNDEKHKTVKLTLNTKDKYVLDKLNKCINHNKPLSLNRNDHKGVFANSQPVYNLIITSKRVSRQLAKFGMFQSKSLSLKFPSFLIREFELLKSFILGFFDGDGSVSSRSRKARKNYPEFSVTFTSNRFFCLYLRRIIKRILGIHCSMNKAVTKSNQTYCLSISGNLQVYRFLEWLYSDENIKMDRKYNKFLELKKFVLNKIKNK